MIWTITTAVIHLADRLQNLLLWAVRSNTFTHRALRICKTVKSTTFIFLNDKWFHSKECFGTGIVILWKRTESEPESSENVKFNVVLKLIDIIVNIKNINSWSKFECFWINKFQVAQISRLFLIIIPFRICHRYEAQGSGYVYIKDLYKGTPAVRWVRYICMCIVIICLK